MSQLTKRQREIVQRLAAGDSQKEIARALGLQYGTVRQHVMAIRKRADCRSTVEVVVRATRSNAPGV